MNEMVPVDDRSGSMVRPESQLATLKRTQPAAPSDWKRFTLFGLLAALYILPFMRILMVGTDEGTLDYGALRVIKGQVFARDFFEVIGPGTFYWLAAFFKIFGVSFFTTRICLFVTSFGTALLMYFLSRRMCGKYQALPCVILAATSFGGLWPAISHHDDSNFFALMAVACIALWVDGYSKRLLLAGGILAGLTTCFLQPKGMLLMVGFVAFVVVQRREGPGLVSALGQLIVGYTSVVGAVLFYFWRESALHDLIYANVVWPSQHYGVVNSVFYGHGILMNYWDHWMAGRAVFPGIVPIGAIMMIPIMYLAILPVLTPLLGARFRWDLQQPQVQLLWLSGVAVWASELHRMDMTHLVFGSPILIILSVHFLTSYAGRLASASLQMLTISGAWLGMFNLLILTVAHPVETRIGTVRMFSDWRAPSFVEKNIPAGEEIFAYPYCPSYYFLHDLVNPTRFSIMVYNYNTKEQFEETIHLLERKKVKYVVWDIGFEQDAAKVFITGRIPLEQQVMEAYLESHYDVMTVLDGKRIMHRKAGIDELH